MSNVDRSQQLDQALEQVLKQRDAAPARGELAPLLRVASMLRGLPHPEFKQRLRAEIERRSTMPATLQSTSPAVAAARTLSVTPYLTVQNAEQVIDFIKDVFDAVEENRGVGSAGGLHCSLRLGDSPVMVGGGLKYAGPYYPTSLHVYVRDTDAAYQRALAAGATSLMAPADQPYGERNAAVRDAGGNEWYLATNLSGDYRPAGAQDAILYLHPNGAERLLEFMKQAFGAEEIEVHRIGAEGELPPEMKASGYATGMVAHAKLRLGASLVELGDAHGQWQPMPSTIFLQVSDADAVFERAVAAGATARQVPSDAPYGIRIGEVQDEFGNRWYMATAVRS